MTRPKCDLKGPKGFPASWDTPPASRPSQTGYNRAYMVVLRHVDLLADWTKGFEYDPQVLVGLPDTRIEIREDADPLAQEGVTMEKTVQHPDYSISGRSNQA